MSSNIMGSRKIGEYVPEPLLGGDFPRASQGIVLKSGKFYRCGSAIGVETATNKGDLVNSGNSDGTEIIHGILAEDVDASAGDAAGVVYLTGEFNQHFLKFGGTDTFETHRKDARRLCIFFKDAAQQPYQ